MEGNMNLGDKVIIKECHSIPALIGKEAKIVVLVDPELTKYPVQVLLTEEAIKMETMFGSGLSKGPFRFREDELEHLDPDHGIPDIFTKQ
jgi:hypothetical protein